MGIVNDVKYNGKFSELKKFIEGNRPEKKDFVSSCGFKPFDSSLIALRPPKNIEISERGKVGILSETYIFVLIAQYSNDKHRLYENIVLKAKQKFENCCNIDKLKGINEYRDLFEETINCIWSFINNESVSEVDVIQKIHILGKALSVDYLEYINDLSSAINKIYYQPCSMEIINEVRAIGNIFKEAFIAGGILKKDSDIVLSPTFGEWSKYIGAYADLYIDGVIYDIKSVDRVAYRGDMVSQIYGYYLAYKLNNKYICKNEMAELSKLSGINSKLTDLYVYEESSLLEKEVHSLALYFSRFGDIEICELNKCKCTLSEEKVTGIAEEIVNKINSKWNVDDAFAHYTKYTLKER